MASTGEAVLAVRPQATARGTLAERFDPRANSIGFLRLALALTVIVSHAWPVGGYGDDPGRADNNLGILAVEGFFALSGLLITRSAMTSPNVGRFLWHRVLRIFPGFWVSLVVVAVLAVAVGAGPSDAVGFVTNNLSLHLGQTTIGATLAGNPVPGLWNGPLYTLAFEFVCYLLVAGLAVTRLLRPGVLAGLTVGCWFYLQAVAGVPWVDDRQARFTLAFLVGATLHAYARRVPITPPMVAAAVVVAVGSYALGGFESVGLPALAYLVVVAAVLLPWRRVGVHTDLSYGVYVYAWPVQQVLYLAGLTVLPLVAYLGATVALVLPLAWLSWRCVERPALGLKRVGQPPIMETRQHARPSTAGETVTVGS